MKEFREINEYKDQAFPVGIYRVTRDKILPKGRGYLDLHWHEELQFTIVMAGMVTMQVNGTLYELKEGEGIFINRNLLHVTSYMTDDGHYISLNFPDKILGFFPGSRMERTNVRPYTRNYLFEALVITPEKPEGREILSIVTEIIKVLQGGKELFEYEISIQLACIWMKMLKLFPDNLKNPGKQYLRKQERMRQMLEYIYEHYMENIQLQDIADHAGVSVGECCRCFKSMILDSPNQYLIHYRLSKAMDLLTSTDMSVTEVAFACGFNDTSHFIRYFKKRAGMTPLAYRNL